MESADYSIMFIHIKGKNNVLGDVISRLKMLNIYNNLLENQKAWVVNYTQEVVMEICATTMHTISTSTMYNEQKRDKMCKKLVSQIYYSNKSHFRSVTMSVGGILQNTPICSWFAAWCNCSTTFISTNFPA